MKLKNEMNPEPEILTMSNPNLKVELHSILMVSFICLS